METEEAEPREGLAGILDRRPALPDPGSHGRGIVICAGGARMFTNAWVLVWQLRRTLRSTLPIEVWHLGPEEMSSGMHAMLEDLGASVVDAHAVLRRFPARISDGWQLKAYALVMSGFREVLLLDADNVPVRDPAFLLDHAEYLRTGAVFWPDAIDIAATNPIWDEAGLPGFYTASWYGIWVPKGTPRAIVNKLNAAIAGALNDPAVQSRFATFGQEVVPDRKSVG